jgi:hypothetical protein
MKTTLCLLTFFLTVSLTAKKVHPGPCDTPPLYTALRYAPVIVYGKFIAKDSSGYTLQVDEVLKGEDIPKKIEGISVILDRKAPYKTIFYKDNPHYNIY